MSRFTAINLSNLDPPDVVEALDYEAILSSLRNDAVARLEAVGIDFDVANLETDPILVILEVAAYRELLLRARVNSASRAVMLAKAKGKDLDHLGAYYGVERALITPATPTTPAVYESDDRFRTRIQLAPEALSTAGPKGAYIFHTMSVDNALIKAVGVDKPAPGEVHVFPLTNVGDGSPDEILLNKIRYRLAENDIRPLTDVVQVLAPTIVNYAVNLTIYVGHGPDLDLVRFEALNRVLSYVAERHRPGGIVRVSGIVAAAHVGGVERVVMGVPIEDIDPTVRGAAYATSVTVNAVRNS